MRVCKQNPLCARELYERPSFRQERFRVVSVMGLEVHDGPWQKWISMGIVIWPEEDTTQVINPKVVIDL